MFNDGMYWERTRAGELRVELRRSSHPHVPPAQEPRCTRSQILYYRDHADNVVAVVHQYPRPDGTLGASGRPDPKRLLHSGKEYLCVESQP